MNFNQFVERNYLELNTKYRKVWREDYKTSFNEFCLYIFTGLKKKMYLPKDYKSNIIFK